jgi:hypothetical protein
MQKRLRRGFGRFSWASKIATKTKKIFVPYKIQKQTKTGKIVLNSLGKRVEFIARGNTKKRETAKTDETWGKFGKPKKKMGRCVREC